MKLPYISFTENSVATVEAMDPYGCGSYHDVVDLLERLDLMSGGYDKLEMLILLNKLETAWMWHMSTPKIR